MKAHAPAPKTAARPPAPPPPARFWVLVKTADEAAQVALLERLTAEGVPCQSLIS